MKQYTLGTKGRCKGSLEFQLVVITLSSRSEDASCLPTHLTKNGDTGTMYVQLLRELVSSSRQQKAVFKKNPSHVLKSFVSCIIPKQMMILTVEVSISAKNHKVPRTSL
jgi:hypothetical protein